MRLRDHLASVEQSEAAHETFQETTVYAMALATWRIEEGRNLKEGDFHRSPVYADDFETWLAWELDSMPTRLPGGT